MRWMFLTLLLPLAFAQILFPGEIRSDAEWNRVDAALKDTLQITTRNTPLILPDPNNTCVTPDQKLGTCGSIRNCPQFISLLHRVSELPAMLDVLRNHICRVFSRAIHMCCPLNNPELTIAFNVSRTSLTPESLVPTISECGIPSGERIINGSEIIVGSWPWLAAIGFPVGSSSFQVLCGGTLITRLHVLTASHCFPPGSSPPTHVRFGEHDVTRTDDGARPVDRRILFSRPRGYNPFTREDDIEIIVLEEEVPYTDFIRPACIPTEARLKNELFEGFSATVVGWGATIPGEVRTSPVPMEAAVTITSNQQCSNLYASNTSAVVDDRNICAGDGSRDACNGDSGGPLNYFDAINQRFYIIGIVSHGVGCADDIFPGVYTRVGGFMGWILNVLDNFGNNE